MILDKKLKNKELWKIFQEISEIPRCSKNEKAIRNYLINKATQANCTYLIDEGGNLLIYKKASKGFEHKKTIMLQGHMDMVCEKAENSNHNFLTDKLDLHIITKKGTPWLTAKSTTLGADNGIALAYGISIIEDENLKCGPITLIFTSNEEIGLCGASKFNPKNVKGERLINLDSEQEGEICVGCAGGVTLVANKKYIFHPIKGYKIKIKLEGFQGGHSGIEIGLSRLNAILEIAKICFEIANYSKLNIIGISAKGKHNVIPQCAEIDILFQESLTKTDLLSKIIDILDTNIAKLRKIEKNSEISLKIDNKIFTNTDKVNNLKSSFSQIKKHVILSKSKINCLSVEESQSALKLLSKTANGVKQWSSIGTNLVETSSNFASLEINKNKSEAVISIRSFKESEIEALYKLLKNSFVALLWGTTKQSQYPSWTPNLNSTFLKTIKTYWQEFSLTESKIRAIHAGLECAILSEKLPNCEMVSIGPTIRKVHTPNEELNMFSAESIYNFIKYILQKDF